MIWSWLLFAIGILAMFFQGRRQAVGWLIALFGQGLWIAYAIQTRQYGFAASSPIVCLLCAKNYRAWRRVERGSGPSAAPARSAEPAPPVEAAAQAERARDSKGE